MENVKTSTFNDYSFADISDDELARITELEQQISSKVKEDIVLIAYKNCLAEQK